MCFDPVSLALMAASTAATAGGNRLNQIASNKAIKGQTALEAARQRKYQADSDQNFHDALGMFDPKTMQDNIAKASASRDSTISGNLVNPTGSYEAANNNQPDIVKSTIAKSLSDAVAKSKGQAQRLAALGANGQVDAGNNIGLGRSASKGAMIGNFAQGSSNVSKAEQEAAAQTHSGFGDALGLLGQGLSMYNMVSSPGRVGDSIFGAQVPDKISTMPSWAPQTSHFSSIGKITNNLPSIF